MKIINKIGDWLYNITDRYFQGENSGVIHETPQFSGQNSEAQTISWELNQGVEDIIVKDLIVSAKYIIPSLIINKIQSIVNRVRFLYLVDAVIEEETLDPKSVKLPEIPPSDIVSGKEIVIKYSSFTTIKTRIISLSEWLKIKLLNLRSVIRYYKRVKPFYLLGDFSPAKYPISANKTKFLDTYVYHLRN